MTGKVPENLPGWDTLNLYIANPYVPWHRRTSRIYLSGPMTGIPDYNFPAFNQAANMLRDLGHSVFNPADRGTQPNKTYEQVLREDILILLGGAEGVVTLPGWESSKGAQLEVTVAKALGIPVRSLSCWTDYTNFTPPKSPPKAAPKSEEAPANPLEGEPHVLQEALDITHGDRNKDYGPAVKDFDRTARLWTVLLEDLLKPGLSLEWQHVARCMRMLKESRICNAWKRDNYVDIAGYAGLEWEIAESQGKFEEHPCQPSSKKETTSSESSTNPEVQFVREWFKEVMQRSMEAVIQHVLKPKPKHEPSTLPEADRSPEKDGKDCKDRNA